MWNLLRGDFTKISSRCNVIFLFPLCFQNIITPWRIETWTPGTSSLSEALKRTSIFNCISSGWLESERRASERDVIKRVWWNSWRIQEQQNSLSDPAKRHFRHGHLYLLASSPYRWHEWARISLFSTKEWRNVTHLSNKCCYWSEWQLRFEPKHLCEKYQTS